MTSHASRKTAMLTASVVAALLAPTGFAVPQARYVELVGVRGANDYVSTAEFNVIGSPAS
jgi:hypothetical protein